MDKIDTFAELIQKNRKICVFTGAGISCPSGIPDFRSENGLYNEKGTVYPPEQIISHSFFLSHTDMFYEFYKSKMLYPDAVPNEAHRFFAQLEAAGKSVSIVTQNIDGLHTLAGSSDVTEIHGSVRRNRCMKCGKMYGVERIANADGVPYCDCGGIIKPEVVLYEEPLCESDTQTALSRVSHSELMIVVGTSLTVYPAASFINYFNGNATVLINKSETGYDGNANLVFHEDIIDVVTKLKRRIFYGLSENK